MNAEWDKLLGEDEYYAAEIYFPSPWPSMIHEPLEMSSDCKVTRSWAWIADGD